MGLVRVMCAALINIYIGFPRDRSVSALCAGTSALFRKILMFNLWLGLLQRSLVVVVEVTVSNRCAKKC